MLCVPAVSADILSTAVPFVSATEANVVAPSANVTAPVGAPAPCGITVAVNVTTWLKLDGLSEESNDVVVGAAFRALILSRTVTPPTARSGFPSPLKSPTAIPGPPAPQIKGDWNVPSP